MVVKKSRNVILGVFGIQILILHTYDFITKKKIE